MIEEWATWLGLRLAGSETFTFARSALPFLSKLVMSMARGPGLARAGQGREGGLARCPDWPWGGRRGSAQPQAEARTAPMPHPRCTRLAEVMLCNRASLSHAVNCYGADQ